MIDPLERDGAAQPFNDPIRIGQRSAGECQLDIAAERVKATLRLVIVVSRSGHRTIWRIAVFR